MKEAVLNLAPQPLRVAILSAGSRRRGQLSAMVQDLGHAVVSDAADASIVLADGVAVDGFPRVVALGAGSDETMGRLPRDAPADQIDAALRAVAAGLSVTVAEELKPKFDSFVEDDEPALLTLREIEVLKAVSDGLTNKEIARALDISRHTVKFHLESLMRKLGVSNRAEAVSKSLRRNLLEPYRL